MTTRFISSLPTALLALSALTLAACAWQPPVPADDRSTAERVRAPAGDESRGLQVYPLQNPAVAELSAAAEQAERDNDLGRAASLLERALRIEPRDPAVLQHLAEIRLSQGDWEQAESQASRSFDVGPRVGELCQRNWRTIALARERLDRFEAAYRARERLQDCQVEPPPRY
jgi:tetratricopeptide (TPR) repeat protein